MQVGGFVNVAEVGVAGEGSCGERGGQEGGEEGDLSEGEGGGAGAYAEGSLGGGVEVCCSCGGGGTWWGGHCLCEMGSIWIGDVNWGGGLVISRWLME